MITALLIICTIILVLSTAEVQFWGFTLNRHAWWVRKHPRTEKRTINYKSLFYTSIFTSLLSIIILISWVWGVVMGGISLPLLFLSFAIGMGGVIILISYLSLIAKLCRLNPYLYPPVTVWICDWIKWRFL